MAGICTAHNRINGAGCDHRTVTIVLDGESFEFETGEARLDALPWTAEEKRQFILWGLKRLRVLGLSLDNAIGRVTNGEEATNVKQYDFIGPGAVVTRTNIGTGYSDVLPGTNGQRILVDFTGCTEFRLVVNVNHATTAAGQLQLRFVRDSDSAVLYESPLLSAAAGEKELDSASDPQSVGGWLPLPAAASGLEIARFQARSTVAQDDPQFRRATMLVR